MHDVSLRQRVGVVARGGVDAALAGATVERGSVGLPLLPSQGLLHLYAPNAAKCIGQLRRSVLGHAVKTANEAAPLRAPTSESSSYHTAPSRSYRAMRYTSKDDSRAASTRRESQLVGEKRLASRGPGFKNLSETNHARPADARAPSAPSWRVVCRG